MLAKVSFRRSVRPYRTKSVLENPDSISKLVLKEKLDARYSFRDFIHRCTDIDIGKDIGAQLQMDQAKLIKISLRLKPKSVVP